jgi:hypothetical protein
VVPHRPGAEGPVQAGMSINDVTLHYEPGCVLIVEDEPLVRFPIAEALRDLGVTVVEAATADAGKGRLALGRT